MTVPRLDRRRRILSRRRAAAWVRRPAAATAGPDLPRDGRQERGRGPPQPLHSFAVTCAKQQERQHNITKHQAPKAMHLENVHSLSSAGSARQTANENTSNTFTSCCFTLSILADSERSLRWWSCPSQPTDRRNSLSISSRSFLPARRCRPASRAGERASV